MNDDLNRLWQFVDRHYDLEELRTLCSTLSVDYDSLRGEGKQAKARELVRYLHRRGQLTPLIAALERGRPDLFDRAAFALAVPYTPSPRPDPNELPDPGDLPPGSRLPFTRNALFTGRVEPLLDLARALLHDESPTTLVTQAVQGMGGIGKTQLAVEFAYRYGRYFRGVHWLNAAQPDALSTEVAACGARMALPGWPPELPDQVERTLHAWRATGPRLVILDNLEEVDAAREWLRRLGGAGVRLLLTARRTDWPDDLGLESLRLDLFAPDESRAFLRRYLAEDRADDADLDALAERLGHLALALELSGRYLKRHRRLTVAAYLDKLTTALDHPAMQNWRADLGSPTKHDLDLSATFTVSWDEVQDKAARQVFVMAGYCAPNQPIPCALLERAADLDDEGCDAALNVLVGLGLLKWEDPVAGPLIHPLLAEYARAQEGTKGLLPSLVDALATLTYQAGKTGLPEQFAPLRLHLETAAVTAQAGGLERAGTLWNNLGSHLQDVADYAEARAAYERALAIDEAVYGPDHPNVATDVNNLGSVLKDLGDLAGARAAFERALAILTNSQLPSDHPYIELVKANLSTL